MTTTHKTTIVGQCPHGCADVYDAEFITGRLIRVEDIQAEIDKATAGAIYQEELTKRLAASLDCRVKTVGTHGRFLTTCEAGE